MLRCNRPLVLAAGLLPLTITPALAQVRSDPYLGISSARVSIAAKRDDAPDIPGVTYPRAAPPDLVPQAAEEDEEEATFASVEETPAPGQTHASVNDASAAPKAAPEAKVHAITLKLEVDLSDQRLTVIENGETKHVWPISSGLQGNATKTGVFRPQWASRLWYSRQYDMAPMPHAVFFNGGIAFHATTATHLLGRPASHGCVRLSPQNARHLYEMIHRHGYARTEINVFGSPKVAGIAGRKAKNVPERRVRPSESAGNLPFGVWSFF